MFFYGFDVYYMILVLPAVFLAMYAQFKVQSTFSKYSNIASAKGITGAEVSRRILDRNGLSNVVVKPIKGNLTDNYNPSNKTVNLSESVFDSTSIAALGVSAHETGHAIQHATKYGPLSIRSLIFPVVRISSMAAFPLALLGLAFGNRLLVNVGIILFSAVVLFQLITLPVEYNASRRALKMLVEYDILSEEEIKGTKSVLSAAALTYLASAITAIANLLRLVLLARNRRN